MNVVVEALDGRSVSSRLNVAVRFSINLQLVDLERSCRLKSTVNWFPVRLDNRTDYIKVTGMVTAI